MNKFMEKIALGYIGIIIAKIVYFFVKNHLNNIICILFYLIFSIILNFPMNFKDLILMYYHLEWLLDVFGIFSLIYCFFNILHTNLQRRKI